MGKAVAMANSTDVKPKARLLDRVLPSVWFIKLRSMGRKPRSSKAPDSEPVIPDSAPFLPKTVANCYKNGVATSEVCDFSPLKTPQTVAMAGQGFTTPSPVKALYRAFPVTTPARKSLMLPDASTRTPVSSIATNTTSSIFSRCTYRSTISSLRNLCKLVGDESLEVKGSSPVSFRKSATPTMRAWFLAGCGSVPRTRGTRHGSMDLEKESGLIELDANTGLECIQGVESFWPKKAESWSGTHPTTWSVELANDEVVKQQVVVKTKRETKAVVSNKVADAKSSSKPKPTLAHLFSKASETDSPRKIFPETEEPYEEEFHAEDAKHAPPWSSLSSFGSVDSTFMTPSEPGLKGDLRKPFPVSDSEPAVPYSEEFDKGNISDSQSLLKAKVLAAERLREGSKSWREQRKLEKQKEEEAAMLLASLDEALDQHNLKRLIEEEDESDPGFDSRFGSPEYELHNSPVFESFLESSAKAWGIDFPALKMDDAKTSGSISDKSRELHCITVQTATGPERERERMQERNRGREVTRGTARANSSPAKARKSKRLTEKEAPKKRSPSRKPSPKDMREERTNHPQREESMVDPELHDEFNNARRKFNESRKRNKQRRSKQVASVPDASPPTLPEKQSGVVKERVAVVVESSYDPYNDFRESMIEMIVDQDIQETGDLEELLQCYLSLNEAEYHNVIVDVFTDVWHELFESNG